MIGKGSRSRSFLSPFWLEWGNLLLDVFWAVVLATSQIICYLYQMIFPKKPVAKKTLRQFKRKKFVMPEWALSRAKELEPPQMSDQQLEALNRRKPPEIWNTVLIFPGPDLLTDPESPPPFTQLKSYLEGAKLSIQICMYLVTNTELTQLVLKKYWEDGLLVQVITDYVTWAVYNINFGAKTWEKEGIEVRMRDNGYLMHNKFLIIDGEAVLTGSLNWTKQGVERNHENVLITTNPGIVSKYEKEFNKLWCLYDPYRRIE